MLRLRGESRLLDGEPTMQRAIQLRNPYTDPMHLMQIDLLHRWRATDRSDKDLFDALLAGQPGSIGALVARPTPDGGSFMKAPVRRAPERS